MRVLGIDPGLTGAMAVLDVENTWIDHVVDIPVAAKTHGTGNQIDHVGLLDQLFEWELLSGIDFVVLERSQPMKKKGRTQGVTSTFSMGVTFGALEQALVGQGWPYVLPLATQWKRQAGLLGKPKEASLTLAKQRHPEAAKWLTRKKDHNRAEAILLARYALSLPEVTGGKTDE